MTLADSSYPLLNIFWTVFIFFSVGDLDLDPDHTVVFIDIFRGHDLRRDASRDAGQARP